MKFAFAAILALPALALATPALVERQTNSTCPVGPLQCCQETVDQDSTVGKTLLKLSKRSDYAGEGRLGVGCSPAIIGSTCSAEPNCCEAEGLVAIGCVPVNVG